MRLNEILKNIRTVSALQNGFDPENLERFKMKNADSDETAISPITGLKLRPELQDLSLKAEFPEEDSSVAPHLFLLKDRWKNISSVMARELAGNPRLSIMPTFAAAYTGSLNAYAVRDSEQNYALVFDCNFHLLYSVIFSYLSKIITKPHSNQVIVLNTLAEMRKNENFDHYVSCIAEHVSAHPFRGLPLHTVRHSFLEKSTANAINYFLCLGFDTFLISHEYAHLILNHHGKLEEFQRSGSRDITEGMLRHYLEHEADRFALQTEAKVINALQPSDEASNSRQQIKDVKFLAASEARMITSLMGVICFFYIVDLIAHVYNVTESLAAGSEPKSHVSLEQSATHPAPLKRLAYMFPGRGGTDPFQSVPHVQAIREIFTMVKTRVDPFILTNIRGPHGRYLTIDAVEHLASSFHLRSF